MTTVRNALLGLCLGSILFAGIGASDAFALGDRDPLRMVLQESKEKNRGVNLHVNGANIPMVVTSIDELYVIGRSQTTSRIVIRLDRIDGVSAMF